jgi:hypothetical protein
MSDVTDRPISDSSPDRARAPSRGWAARTQGFGAHPGDRRRLQVARQVCGTARCTAGRTQPASGIAAVRPIAVPVETVTLNKIGDFLELDFGRLFAWMGRGRMLA